MTTALVMTTALDWAMSPEDAAAARWLAVYGMDRDEWDAYGSRPIPCDDCGRDDGTHNMEVEH